MGIFDRHQVQELAFRFILRFDFAEFLSLNAFLEKSFMNMPSIRKSMDTTN